MLCAVTSRKTTGLASSACISSKTRSSPFEAPPRLLRRGYAFHPVHGILATHPLKRLRHAGRVFVVGADDPAVPRHVGFIPTATVEEAIAEAEGIHDPDCSIICAG